MEFPYKLVDLTHTLDENSPSWDGTCGFKHAIKLDYEECSTGVKFRVGQFKMNAGIGTHIDAPNHCISGGKAIDQLLLDNLVSPCIVIDISTKAHENYCVSIQDITEFERTYGIILESTFVMIKTGWDRFWHEPEKYRNNLVFPSVSEEAARLLVERGVSGIGIDTLSPDCLKSGFPVHQAFLSAGKYIVENAANLDILPPNGSFIMVLPIKVKGATEAPVRLIGLIDKNIK
jgi:kynurenine formamidase